LKIGSRMYVASDVSLNGGLFLSGDASLNSNLKIGSRMYVASDVSLNNRLFVSGDASLNSNLRIGSNFYVTNDVSLNNRLFVSGDASLNSTLKVGSRMYVGSDVSLNGGLFLSGDASLNSNLKIGSRMYVASDVSLNGGLFLSGDASLNSTLKVGTRMYVGSDVSLNGGLFLSGDASLNSTLKVGTRMYVGSDVSLNGGLFLSGDASLNNNLKVGSRMYVANDVSLNSRLFVSGDASLNSNLKVGSRMYVASDVSLNGGLFLSGDASLNSTLKVGSRMYVANDVSLNSRLFVSGDASLNSNLKVGNSVSVYGNVNSVGGFSENGVFLNATYAKLSGSTFVNDVIINGNLNATTLFENGYPVSINRDVIQIASSTPNATYSFSQINAGDIYFISSGSALNYYGNVVLPISNNEQIYTYLINAQTVGSRAFNLKTTTGTFEPWGVSTFVLQPGSNALLKGRTDGGWHLIGGNYDSARLTAYNNTFTGITTFLADTSMNSNLKVGSRMYVASDVSLNGGLFLSGDASLNSNLRIGSRMYVASDVSLNGRLFLSGDASFNGNLFMSGNLYTTDSGEGWLGYSGNSRLSNNNTETQLGANTNLRFYTGTTSATMGTERMTLLLNGNVGIGTSTPAYVFDVVGASRFQTAPLMSGANITAASIPDSALSANIPELNAAQTFTALQTISMGSATDGLRVTKFGTNGSSYIVLNNGLIGTWNGAQINWQIDFSGNLTTSGNVGIGTAVGTVPSYKLDVNGASRFQSRMYVASDVSLNGGMFLSGDASLNSNLKVGSRMYVASDVSLNGGMFLSGDASLNNNLKVGSRMYIGSDVSLNGRLFLSGDASLNSNLRIGSRMYVASDVSLNGKLFLSGDASFNGNLVMSGNLYTTDSGEGWLGYSGNSRLANNNTETQLGANTNLRFYTGTTSATMGNEKITLLLNGNVGIGNATPAYTLDITGNIRATGTSTASSFNATSDRRLKTNIEPLSSQWNNIKLLQPAQYKWIHTSKPDHGFIAQDVYRLYPDMRTRFGLDPSNIEFPTDYSGNPLYYTLDYSKMTPYLWKGLQEAIQTIESQQKQINALTEKVDALVAASLRSTP